MNKNFIFTLSLATVLLLSGCSKEDISTESRTATEDATAKHPGQDTPLIVTDSLALVDLYKALDGPNWSYSNWTKTPLRFWEGVELSLVDGQMRVTSVELAGNYIKGQLPSQIKMLSELKRLRITNSIFLDGPIIDEVYDLKKLRVLDFRFTELTGELSPRIGQLTQLDTLVLWKSQFAASTSEEVNWKPNTVLFSGSIPVEIGKLTQLKELNFARAGFQGEIPAQIGNLALATRVDLSENRLTGSIPSSIGNLKNLQWIALCKNQLTGQIPSEICNIASLKTFIVSNNLLTGTIPTEIGDLSELNYFAIEHNQITGSIPKSLENCLKLGLFYAGNNQLTGEIPSELGCHHPWLIGLYLENNNLTGSLPDTKGNVISTGTWYTTFSVYGNRLTGSVPQGLIDMNSLGEQSKHMLPQQDGFGFDNLK